MSTTVTSYTDQHIFIQHYCVSIAVQNASVKFWNLL